MALPTSTADVKFTIIGRQPELLKRFQSSETSSNNFAPSPSRSPSPNSPVHPIPENRSRPSLLDVLGPHESETSFASFAPALDETKPTPIDLDCESSLHLQYPPTPSERPSPIFASLSTIQSRISSLCLPNTSPALLLVQSAQERSTDAFGLALRAKNLAQESLNSAQEAASVAQEALTANNEAKASVTAIIKAINDIGFAENGTGSCRTLEWKQTFQTLKTDLNQLTQWITDRETERQAEEQAMKAEKASFHAQKTAFAEEKTAFAEEKGAFAGEKRAFADEKRVLADERRAFEEQRQAVEEAAQKQAAEEVVKKEVVEEELERKDEKSREDKEKRAAEEQRKIDLRKRQEEKQRQEEARRQQEKMRQEVKQMKQRDRLEEAAKILAKRATNQNPSNCPPSPTSPEPGSSNNHSPVVVTHSSETRKEDSADKLGQRVNGLSPKLARSAALASRDGEVAPANPSNSFPSRSFFQSAGEHRPVAYCLSSDKGNLPIVDDDHGLLPHVQETNLFAVIQGHRDPQVHSSISAVAASPKAAMLPRSGVKAPAAQTPNPPFSNLAASPLSQIVITPFSSHRSNGHAMPPIAHTPKPASQSSHGPVQNRPPSVPTRSIPDVSEADPPSRLSMRPRPVSTMLSQATRSQPTPDVTRVLPPASMPNTTAPRQTPQSQPHTNVMSISVAQKTSKTGGKARKQAVAPTTLANLPRVWESGYRPPSPISPDMLGGGDGGWDRFHTQDEPQPQARMRHTSKIQHKATYERSPSRHYSPRYSSPPRASTPYPYRLSPQPVTGHKRLRDDEDHDQFRPAQKVKGDVDYSTRTSQYWSTDPFTTRLVDRARTPPRTQTQLPLAGSSHTQQRQSNEKPGLLDRLSDHHQPQTPDSIPLTERVQGTRRVQDSLLARLR